MKYFDHVSLNFQYYYYHPSTRYSFSVEIVNILHHDPMRSRLPYRLLVLIITTLSSPSEELVVPISIGKRNGSMNDVYYVNHCRIISR